MRSICPQRFAASSRKTSKRCLHGLRLHCSDASGVASSVQTNSILRRGAYGSSPRQCESMVIGAIDENSSRRMSKMFHGLRGCALTERTSVLSLRQLCGCSALDAISRCMQQSNDNRKASLAAHNAIPTSPSRSMSRLKSCEICSYQLLFALRRHECSIRRGIAREKSQSFREIFRLALTTVLNF